MGQLGWVTGATYSCKTGIIGNSRGSRSEVGPVSGRWTGFLSNNNDLGQSIAAALGPLPRGAAALAGAIPEVHRPQGR